MEDTEGRDPWQGRTCGECRYMADVDGVALVCCWCAVEEGWAKVDPVEAGRRACEGFEAVA